MWSGGMLRDKEGRVGVVGACVPLRADEHIPYIWAHLPTVWWRVHSDFQPEGTTRGSITCHLIRDKPANRHLMQMAFTISCKSTYSQSQLVGSDPAV